MDDNERRYDSKWMMDDVLDIIVTGVNEIGDDDTWDFPEAKAERRILSGRVVIKLVDHNKMFEVTVKEVTE